MPAAHKIWPKQRLSSALGELGKSIWSAQKKVKKKFQTFFANPPPPRENSRSAPD